jgi:glycosyltransferase involved in cell wall biosynthesis
MYYLSTWISAIIARIIGRKVIFWTHGFIREENNFIGFIRSIFYKIPNEILVYGLRAKNILISKGFSAEKVTLIFNSLDFEKQDVFYKKKVIIKDLFVNQKLSIVGFIGRLTRQKRIHLLIEVLHSMPKGKKFNLLIIGDGDQLTFLKNMVHDFNLCEYVLFKGAVYDEQQNCNLINMMDVLISPGEVGLTAIHSMTYGTPVITHDRFDKQMPEYEVIIPGLTGDFFDYSNPIKSIVKLLPLYLDNKDRYTNECRKIIKQKYNKKNQLLIFNSVV